MRAAPELPEDASRGGRNHSSGPPPSGRARDRVVTLRADAADWKQVVRGRPRDSLDRAAAGGPCWQHGVVSPPSAGDRPSAQGVGESGEDVEDVVQETLLTPQLKRHTCDERRPLSPWL